MNCIVHGLLQARILEWVTFPFSSPGDLSNPGIKPRSPALQADSLLADHLVSPKGLEASAFSLLERSLLEIIHHRVRSLAFLLQSPCGEHMWRGHVEKRLGTEVE